MCGIIAFAKSTDDPSFVLDILKALQYRGYDSGGLCFQTTDHTKVQRKWLGGVPDLKLPSYDYTMGMAHTRWATHGKVNKKNTHPITSGNVTIVHNGIVENHQKYAGTRHTDTDTEAIATYINDRIMMGWSIVEAIEQAAEFFNNKMGAFVLHWDTVPRRSGLTPPVWNALFAYTDGPPLYYTRSGLICSNLEVLSGYEKEAFLIDSGGIVEISEGQIIRRKMGATLLDVPEIAIANFDEAYMPREIQEQLDLILDRKTYTKIIYADERTVMLGCGSSYYAAMVAACILRTEGYDVTAEYATEAQFNKRAKNYIFVSQSGETKDLIDFKRKYREQLKGKQLVYVQNKATSPLSQSFDYHGAVVVNIKAGPEIGVAATKTFTLSILSLLEIAGIKTKLSSIVKGIGDHWQHTLDHCKEMGEYIAGFKNVLILGTEEYYPLALEAALKFKEIAQIHAEAMPAAEIKHGPIALVDKNTLTLVLRSPRKAHGNKVEDNIRQIQARGGPVIDLVGQQWLLDTIIRFQLIALYATSFKGLDCDKPRNLAKTVTV